MASNYTCRICSRAIGADKVLARKTPDLKTAFNARKFSISADRCQWSTTTIPVRPTRAAQPPLSYFASACRRSYATQTAKKGTVTLKTTTAEQGHVPELAKIKNNAEEKDLLAQITDLQSKGKRVAVEDKDGEVHVLAEVPDDVRTYNWKTSAWSWGVLERLFQDCEQAKLTFELEEYIDEVDGKTKKRVKRDQNGMHMGQGGGWWFNEIGLPKTFNTWASVCFLHMWILKVRIRQFPQPMHDNWTELLTNHFFWEAEKTMDLVHKMGGTQRKEYLDTYWQIWRGTLLAYDEGMIKGDAVLAAAIWRQLFNADRDAEPLKIALVTAYMRREVARVGQLSDKVLARGYVGFGKPISETDILMQSPKMRVPFNASSTGRSSLPSSSMVPSAA